MRDKIKATDEIPAHLMEKFAQLLDPLLQGRGFCLIVSPALKDLPTQYVSNVNRHDAQDMLERLLEKWRKQS